MFMLEPAQSQLHGRSVARQNVKKIKNKMTGAAGFRK
jgi:hypothetical protein